MNRVRVILITLIAGFFLLSGQQAGAANSEFVKAFMRAYNSKDILGMGELVKSNQNKVPAEVRALVKEALKTGTDPADKTADFFVAELLAREYNNLTEDASLLIELKQREFNSKLHEAVISKSVNGVTTLEIPLGSEKEKNIFKPDNIIIKEGETVQWKNNDTIAHIFASMPLIGNGGIFTPNLESGATWEFKFDKPGEYYYLCFIHQGMIGKVTVLAAKKKENKGIKDATESLKGENSDKKETETAKEADGGIKDKNEKEKKTD